MALADLGDAFIKPTALQIRQYMRAALRGALEQYDRLVIPLAGRFDMAETAIDAGWRVGEVQCRDTNLYSAVLGYMASGRELGDLNIRFAHDSAEAEWARAKLDTGSYAAAVFLMMKLASLRDGDTGARLVRQELWEHRDHYANHYQASAQRLAEKLNGLDFDVADVFGVVSDAAADERAVVYIDPPRTVRDSFACVGEPGAWISWNKPLITPFEAKTGMDKLHHDLMPAAALGFFHWHGSNIPEDYKPRSVYAIERNVRVREHVLCNRPDEANMLVRTRQVSDIEHAPYPEIPLDHKISEQSRFEVVPVSKAVGLYHADLWRTRRPYRLGQSFAALVDGYIAAVWGINFQAIRTSRGPWIELSYRAFPYHPHVLAALPFWIASGPAWTVYEYMANAPLFPVRELRVVVTGQPGGPIEGDCTRWVSAGLSVETRERREDGNDKITLLGTPESWKPHLF